MENIFVRFLPPWIETGIQPAFYDKESGTVLQQVARMYAKVNYLIAMFNKFTKDTNTEIENFEEQIDTRVTDFEDSVNDTVDDYIDKFNRLHDFVDDYFDNLDVQDEVDHKIDEMVTDGTFDRIINQEIFGEINADIADLYAKLGTLANLETPVKTSIVTAINSVIHHKYVLVGDSYLGGYDGSTTVNSWGYYFKDCNGISSDDCYIWYESGAGFVRAGGDHGYNFKSLIEAKVATISNANEITDVIICGGVNDHSYDIGTITNSMSACIASAKTNFPNATIYVGCISNKSTYNENVTRQQINDRVLYVYRQCGKYGARYLSNIEQICHDWSNFGVDGVHFTQDGYQKIGAGLMDAMHGSYHYTNTSHDVTLTVGGTSITDSSKTITCKEFYVGDSKALMIREFNLNDFTAFSQSGTEIMLTPTGEVEKFNYFRNINQYYPSICCDLELTFSDSQYNGYYNGVLMFNSSGVLEFYTNSTINAKTISGIRLRQPLSISIPALEC